MTVVNTQITAKAPVSADSVVDGQKTRPEVPVSDVAWSDASSALSEPVQTNNLFGASKVGVTSVPNPSEGQERESVTVSDDVKKSVTVEDELAEDVGEGDAKPSNNSSKARPGANSEKTDGKDRPGSASGSNQKDRAGASNEGPRLEEPEGRRRWGGKSRRRGHRSSCETSCNTKPRGLFRSLAALFTNGLSEMAYPSDNVTIIREVYIQESPESAAAANKTQKEDPEKGKVNPTPQPSATSGETVLKAKQDEIDAANKAAEEKMVAKKADAQESEKTADALPQSTPASGTTPQESGSQVVASNGSNITVPKSRPGSEVVAADTVGTQENDDKNTQDKRPPARV